MMKTAYTSMHNYVNHGKAKLKDSQAVTAPPQIIEWTSTPSQSQASFGGYFTIDYKTKLVTLLEAKLEFNVNALSTSNMSNVSFCRFVPSVFWFDHIEIVANGTDVLETIYPMDVYTKYQLFLESDETRTIFNLAMGGSTVQRNTLSGTTSSWYVPLWCILGSTKHPILHTSDYQIRVYMQPLANIYETDGTGSPTTSINYVNLWTRQVRMNTHELGAVRSIMLKTPLNFRYSETRVQKFTQQSGVSTCNLVLTSITGAVSWLYFVVQPVSATGTNLYTNFTAIQSFELLNQSQTNFIGGQPYYASFAKYVSPLAWGISTTFLNSENIYIYSWSHNPKIQENLGYHLGKHHFTGSETLKITFPSTLGSAVVITVYAHVLSHLNVNTIGASKTNVLE